MNSRPYCNNLRKGDRVYDVELQRYGRVHSAPRETSVTSSIMFEGESIAKRRFVDKLRLDPAGGGKPEEVPPIDGEFPSVKSEPPARSSMFDGNRDSSAMKSLVDDITTKRNELKAELDAIQTRFRVVKAEIERLDAALTILEAPAKPGP